MLLIRYKAGSWWDVLEDFETQRTVRILATQKYTRVSKEQSFSFTYTDDEHVKSKVGCVEKIVSMTFPAKVGCSETARIHIGQHMREGGSAYETMNRTRRFLLQFKIFPGALYRSQM